MKSPKSLDENILYQISETQKLIHDVISQIFNEANFGVTVEQFAILALLWYEEGINQQDIATGLKRDKTTIARVVENMVKNGLVTKVSDSTDRRNNLIHLTTKGRLLQKDMVASSGSVYFDALKGIKQRNIKAGVALLQKIQQNLT